VGAEPAYVALGSNLGDPLAQLRRAAEALGALGEVVGRSSLYRTLPVGGPPGQPDYLNAVVALLPDPGLTPETLLKGLLEIEQRQGRERRVRWGARTLDLDLLAWGARVVEGERLTLPHPRMMERAFVLTPLCEVAPAWRHPVTGLGACEALGALLSRGIVKTDLRWR